MLYSPCLPDTLPLYFSLTFSHRSLTAGSEDRCADPGIPAGARRSGSSFGIDDILSYRCDDSLHLLGSKTRVCQESGQWTGTEPKCYCKAQKDTQNNNSFPSNTTQSRLVHCSKMPKDCHVQSTVKNRDLSCGCLVLLFLLQTSTRMTLRWRSRRPSAVLSERAFRWQRPLVGLHNT